MQQNQSSSFQGDWEEVLNRLKEETTNVTFSTWMKPLKFVSFENRTLTLLTCDEMSKNILEQRYMKNILQKAEEVFPELETILVRVSAETPVIQSIDRSKCNLNSKYVFDNFIIGNSNRMAYAASLAVADSPAGAYNPLFLYSGVGLGKTHLMHSIGNQILLKNPNAKVLYVSSEKFTNELIQAIQYNNNEQFRSRYRNIDVLLIDDIQFIMGKERTQEEFFHTFNTLYESNKQIIISSDRPPKEIETLEERLRSRFEMGLIVDIGSPDFETRLAILKQKSMVEKYQSKMPDDVLLFLANSITSNIRQLEGAINRIIALAALKNIPIHVDLAREALKEILETKQNVLTVEYIQEIVASHYHLKIDDFKSKKRVKEIMTPRQVAIYLTRKLTDTSLPKIGVYFGGRDHSTIIHSIEKIEGEIVHDVVLKNTILDIEHKIRSC